MKKQVSKKAKSKLSPTVKRIVIIIGVIAMCVLAWSVYGAYDKQRISKVADSFKPDPRWELTSEHTLGPSVFCIDEPCPYVQKTWKSNEITGQDEFNSKLVNDSIKKYSCKESADEHNIFCSSTYVYKNYRFFVTYDFNPEDKGEWYLSVQQNNK